MANSRFRQYVEDYAKIHPELRFTLSSATIAMVGRSLRHLPASLMIKEIDPETHQVSEKLRQVINPRFIERLYQENKDLLKKITLNNKQEVNLSKADDMRVAELAKYIIQMALSELLDSIGHLHSEVVYFLSLKTLINDHGSDEVTYRVVWSYCHELVGAAISDHLQKQLMFSEPREDDVKIANHLLALNLLFAKYITLDFIKEKLDKDRQEKDFIHLMDHFDSFVAREIVAIPQEFHVTLKKYILQDLFRIHLLKDNKDLYKSMFSMRRAFWANLVMELTHAQPVLAQMIADVLKQAKPELNNKVSYRFPELEPWFNIRDNNYLLHDLIKFANFKQKKGWVSVSELLHETLMNKSRMQLEPNTLLVSLSLSHLVLKEVIKAYMPFLNVEHRQGFFTTSSFNSSSADFNLNTSPVSNVLPKK